MRCRYTAVVVLAALALAPAAAHAQGTSQFAGVVTDNTGGILPGVTIEASSPALIEGSRVAITDGKGRYLLVDLRPGTSPFKVHVTRTSEAPPQTNKHVG